MLGMILVGVGTFAVTVGAVWAMLNRLKKESEKAMVMAGRIASIQNMPPPETVVAEEADTEGKPEIPAHPAEVVKALIKEYANWTPHEWDSVKQTLWSVKP